MKRFYVLVTSFFFLSASAFAQSVVKLPVPEIETLPNGLKIAWFLNDHIPVVDLSLIVQAGYRDDLEGKSGTAELLAEAMDRGAAGMNAQQLARAAEVLGASRYISADDDSFSLGIHGLAPDADALLDLLGKVVTRPELKESEVRWVHERILDSWSHIGDNAGTLAGLAYSRLLSAGTPYARGSLLSVEEFKKVGKSDILAFYQTHFTPDNSILMVVGRVEKDSFKKRIQEAFGAWKKSSARRTPQQKLKTFADARLKSQKGEILIVDRPGLNQAQVRIGARAPLINAPEHYALVVGNAILGGYFDSRLNSLIRDKLALTYGISSSFSYSKEFASFTVSSSTKNSSVGQLILKTLEVLSEFKKAPVPSSEMQTAKEYLTGGFPLATATLGSVASRWINGYLFDLGPGYLNEFVPSVEKVTEKEILSAMSKNFRDDGWVIVIAGDADEIEKSLRAAKLTRIKRVSVRDLS